MDPEEKQKLNPAQSDIDEKVKFDNLLKAEKSPEVAPQEEGEVSDLDSVKNQEESGNGKQGFYRQGASGGSAKATLSGTLKKRGPLGLIIALVIGGGIGLSTLFSPAILIVQLKEVMVGKFNTQLASMDARTTKLINSKTNEALSGHCGSIVTIRCRYSTMSEKQVAKFKAAGIEVVADEKTSLLGRTKPKAFQFQGKTISAAEFKNEMIRNADFRNAVRKAYNPKFAGFADKVWSGVKAKIGIKEGAPKEVKDVEERKSDLEETSRQTDANENVNEIKKGDKSPLCQSSPCSEEDAKAATEKLKSNVEKFKGAKGAASSIGEGIGHIKGATSAISIMGAVEYACQAYGAIQLTAHAAKIVRSLQLARYAFTFLTVADMIKAGDATPDTVSQLGTILNTPSPGASLTSDTRGTATDSFGYKYAAYSDTPAMTEYTSQFLAGGGLTGQISSVSNKVLDLLGGRQNAKTTCRTLANPWVAAGSLVAGIAFLFVPGVGVGKAIAQAALGIAFGVALAVLPNLLSDIIAGKVTEGIQGEDTGDAITSGSGTAMSTVSNNGGNAPLTVDQAIAYLNIQQSVADSYLKDEALALSPFDASNKFTFMGSVVNSLMPYSSQAFTLRGGIKSSLSLVGSSIKSVLPSASAVSAEQQKAALALCQDFDYADIGIAADPFCNPIFGVPSQYLETDPITVVDDLVANGYYTEDSNGDVTKTQKYTDFIDNCINRADTFGFEDPNDSESEKKNGKDCIIDSKIKSEAYVNFIDERVDDSMDGYTLGTTGSANTTGGSCTDLLDGKYKIPTCVGPTGQERVPDMDGIMRGQGGGDEGLTFGDSFRKVPESERGDFAKYYITMRWTYSRWRWDGSSTLVDNEQFNYYAKNLPRVVITNPNNGKSIVFAVIESGPGPSIGSTWRAQHNNESSPAPDWWLDGKTQDPPGYDGIVSGITPYGMEALGIKSSDLGYDGNPKSVKLQYAWAADQTARPGSVATTPASNSTVNCTNVTGNARLVCSAKKYLGYPYWGSGSNCYGNQDGGSDGYPGSDWVKLVNANPSRQINGQPICIGCSGFVNAVFYDAFYKDTAHCSLDYASDSDFVAVKDRSTLQPGDVLIMNNNPCNGDRSNANHIGIVESYDVKTGKINSLESSSKGSARYTRDSEYWAIALRYNGKVYKVQ